MTNPPLFDEFILSLLRIIPLESYNALSAVDRRCNQLSKQVTLPLTWRPDIMRSIMKKKQHQPVRFPCRNSYERKKIHMLAERYGVAHRSIIDYRRYFVNTKEEICEYGYVNEESRYRVSVWPTPQSYVEINNGFVKEEIGSPEDLPPSFNDEMLGYCLPRFLRNLPM